MPEAVIVSTARSPIGRAMQGSLKGMRPDDLAAQMVRAALDKVPELDPTEIDDLHAGLRPARRRAGLQHGAASSPCSSATTSCPAPPSPGTARRRCRPPAWRCTRSRPARATCSSPPASRPSPGSPRAAPTRCPTPRTRCSPTPQARTERARRRAAEQWTDPREDGPAPRRLHRDGPDRRERRPDHRHHPRGAGPAGRCARRTAPRQAIDERLLRPRDHPGHPARRHRRQPPTTAPAPAPPTRRSASSSRCSGPTAPSPPATLPAQRRRRRAGDHVATPRPRSSA